MIARTSAVSNKTELIAHWLHLVIRRYRLTGQALIYVVTSALSLGSASAWQATTSVATYHNDPQRTGWNATEKTLTPTNVRPGNFDFYTSVVLDDRIDTQPLVVAGTPDTVYVATEGNTVYAINPGGPKTFPFPPTPATIITKRNLGAPVPLPLGCQDSGGNVGINGTPTIDLATRTMYVIAYTLLNGTPAYQLHKLDLSTLKDKSGSPITITASHTLANGTRISFDARVQRQRPALLLADGNVYAGFGSFCDWTTTSRGWLLAWNATSLAPLASNEVTDTETTATSKGCPQNCFLGSIWMSGFGIAAETPGDIFFVTGNSGGTYNGTTDIQESVVKVAPNLATVHHIFTPQNYSALDGADEDFGSGGVMIVPNQPGPEPLLAVAAGKEGTLYILNRSDLGGLSKQPSVNIGECWCGPSYFKGSDGAGRVVSSGGLTAKTWKINTAASPQLQLEASAPSLAATGEDPGFFTSISSNGTNANTSIIWALGRPTKTASQVILYAFNGTQSGGSLPLLWSGVGGSRLATDHNANLVPTVANGKVYVASYQLLKIAAVTGGPLIQVPEVTFSPTAVASKEVIAAGLVPKFTGSGTWVSLQSPPGNSLAAKGSTVTMTLHSGIIPIRPVVKNVAASMLPPGAVYWGTIASVEGPHITIKLRTDTTLSADLSQAIKNGTVIEPIVGKNVVASGTLNSDGSLNVTAISRAKDPVTWGSDRSQ